MTPARVRAERRAPTRSCPYCLRARGIDERLLVSVRPAVQRGDVVDGPGIHDFFPERHVDFACLGCGYGEIEPLTARAPRRGRRR